MRTLIHTIIHISLQIPYPSPHSPHQQGSILIWETRTRFDSSTLLGINLRSIKQTLSCLIDSLHAIWETTLASNVRTECMFRVHDYFLPLGRVGLESARVRISIGGWRRFAWGWGGMVWLEAGCPGCVVSLVVVLEDRLLRTEVLSCYQ